MYPPASVSPAVGIRIPSEVSVADALSQISQGTQRAHLAPTSQISQGMQASSMAQALATQQPMGADALDEPKSGRSRWLWIAIAVLLVMMAAALGALIWFFPA
jgi:hypothetical protein